MGHNPFARVAHLTACHQSISLPLRVPPATSRGTGGLHCSGSRLDPRAWRRRGCFAILARHGAAGPVGAGDRRGQTHRPLDRARARGARSQRDRALQRLGRRGRGDRARDRGARRACARAPRRPRTRRRRGPARTRGRGALGRRGRAREQRLQLSARTLRRVDRSHLGREPRRELEGALPPRLAPRPGDAGARPRPHRQPGRLGG